LTEGGENAGSSLSPPHAASEPALALSKIGAFVVVCALVASPPQPVERESTKGEGS
jgi:hypothetical protein